MVERVMRAGVLDRVAMSLSGLCVVHCLVTAIFIGLVSSAGAMVGSHEVHAVGLVIAMLLGAVALGGGILRHGDMMPAVVGALGLGVMAGALALPHGGIETAFTLVGVLLLAVGHQLNRRAVV